MSFDFTPLVFIALAVAAYLLIRVPRSLFAEAAEAQPGSGLEWGLTLVLALAGIAAYAACGGHTPMARLAFALAAMSFAGIVYADISHRIVPDLYSGLLIFIAVFAPWKLPLVQVLTGAVLCGGLLWALGFIWRTMKSQEGFGLGDMKLAAAVGALVGPQFGLLALSLSAVVAAGLFLALRAIRKPASEEDQPVLPFGPVLALAGMGFLAHGLI